MEVRILEGKFVILTQLMICVIENLKFGSAPQAWALVCEWEEKQDLIDPSNELPGGPNWARGFATKNRPTKHLAALMGENTNAYQD